MGFEPSILVDVGRAVDGSTAALGEKIDLVGDDLAAVAFGAVLVFPLGVVNAPLERDQLALAAELGNVLTQAIEASDPMELAILVLPSGQTLIARGGKSGGHVKTQKTVKLQLDRVLEATRIHRHLHRLRRIFDAKPAN